MSVDTYPGTTNRVLPPDTLAAIDKAVGWPQADIAQAVAIELNQSVGGNTAAYNPTDPDGGSEGLFQINGVHGPNAYLTSQFAQQMSDPAANSAEALSLFKGQGWAPWYGDPSFPPSNGGPNPPTYQNLAAGEQAAASVANETPATLTAKLTSSNGPFPGGQWDPLNVPWEVGGAAASAAGKVAGAAGSAAVHAVGGTVLKYVLEGVAAVAGLGLIVLALRDAGGGGHDKGDDHGSIVHDLAIGAAA